MEKEVDIEEIKRTLKDANMYEMNLSNEDLISYYAVLKNSENTATEEEISRNLNKTLDAETSEVVENSDEEESQQIVAPLRSGKKPFVPKTWSSFKNSTEAQNNKRKNQNSDETSKLIDEIPIDNDEKPKDATKVIFGFNEMLESSMKKTNLNIVHHDYKFIPIQCTERFLKADIKTKAKILYSYHSKMLDIRNQLARTILNPAPIPKPIAMSDKYPNLSDCGDHSETYVSRSGRLTKRKFYCDENSLDDDFVATNKKTKSVNEDWLEKSEVTKASNKAKIHPRDNSLSNEIPDTNKTILEDTSECDDKIDVTTVSEDKKEVSEKYKSEEGTINSKTKSTGKPQISKKLSNSEIMQRSRLFKESKKGSRAAMLFDKLVEDNEKKQKEEKARDDFEKTLETIENDDDYHKDDVSDNERVEIVDVEEEHPKKRRVLPPIPCRKPIGKRKPVNSEVTPLSVVVERLSPKKGKPQSPSVSGKPEVASSSKKRTNISRKLSGSDKKTPATTSQKDTQDCPICSQAFHIDEIENHAATCGDDAEVVTRSSMKLSKMTCDICDAVIPVSTEYEVHVKDCIKAKQLEQNN